MSINALLDDGTTPDSWKRIAVANLRALVSSITGNQTVGGNLTVTGNQAIDGTLNVAGLSTMKQIFTDVGISLPSNNPANNFNRYLILDSGPTDVPGMLLQNVAVRYTRVGRQSTLFVFNPAGAGHMTVGGLPVAEISITYISLGQVMDNAITPDVATLNPFGITTYPAGAPAEVLSAHATDLDIKIRLIGGGNILANSEISNFSISWVSN